MTLPRLYQPPYYSFKTFSGAYKQGYVYFGTNNPKIQKSWHNQIQYLKLSLAQYPYKHQAEMMFLLHRITLIP